MILRIKASKAEPLPGFKVSAPPMQKIVKGNDRITVTQSIDVVDANGEVMMTITHCGNGVRILGRFKNSHGLSIRPRVSNVVEVVGDDEPPF